MLCEQPTSSACAPRRPCDSLRSLFRDTLVVVVYARAAVLLICAASAVALAATACGGSLSPAPSSYRDAASVDAVDATTDGATEWPDTGWTLLDDANDSASRLPDAAPCADDAIAPESGATFPCYDFSDAGPICWSGSQFCLWGTTGQIRHLRPDWTWQACNPLPCACATDPTCACVSRFFPGCMCSEDAGGATVACIAP